MSYKIRLNNKEIEQQEHRSVLDAIIAATLDNQALIDYQCRDGYCGACRCKLLSGEVGYIRSTLACLAENEILLCSVIALSDVELVT